MTMELNEIRSEIESVDMQILQLTKRRLELAREVGLNKAKTGVPSGTSPWRTRSSTDTGDSPLRTV